MYTTGDNAALLSIKAAHIAHMQTREIEEKARVLHFSSILRPSGVFGQSNQCMLNEMRSKPSQIVIGNFWSESIFKGFPVRNLLVLNLLQDFSLVFYYCFLFLH